MTNTFLKRDVRYPDTASKIFVSKTLANDSALRGSMLKHVEHWYHCVKEQCFDIVFYPTNFFT